MKRCYRCKKIILYGNLCSNCTQIAKMYINNLGNKIHKTNSDIQKGYKKLQPYFSWYKILLDRAKEFYETAYLIPNQINLQPRTYEEYKKNVIGMMTDMLSKKQISLFTKFADTGEVQYINDMIKLRDEMIDIKVEFPEFENLIDISELQEVIDKSKLREKL